MNHKIKKLIEDNIDLIDENKISTLFLVAANHHLIDSEMIELIVILESAEIKTYEAREKALDTLLVQAFAMTQGVDEAVLGDFLDGNLNSRFVFLSTQITDYIKVNFRNYSKWIDIDWNDEDPWRSVVRWKN